MRGGRLYFLWFCTQRPRPFAQLYYSRYAAKRAHTLISSRHNHTHKIAFFISFFCRLGFIFNYTHSFDHHIFWQRWEGLTQRFSLLFRITISFTFFVVNSCWILINPELVSFFYSNMGGKWGDEVWGVRHRIFFCTVGCICFTIGAAFWPRAFAAVVFDREHSLRWTISHWYAWAIHGFFST